VVLATCLALTYRRNGFVDICHLELGDFSVFYLNALLGIGVVLIISSLLPATGTARLLAENTIVIFPLHLIAFGLLTAVAMYGFQLEKDFKDGSLIWSLGYTVTAVGICLLCVPVLHRFLPWAVGLSGESMHVPEGGRRTGAGIA
jgi:acyltransferase